MTEWIKKKKKKDNKKFYGYTGPVKPGSSWITRKDEPKSYGYTEVVKQKKEPTTWIKKKEMKEPLPTIDSKWLKKKYKKKGKLYTQKKK